MAQRFIAGFKSRERSKSRRDERNENSIGISGVDDTVKYIQNQPEHHRKMTFSEEVAVFLKKHGMEHDEAMLE